MNNFDLKKYLQNNLLLKEDIDVTNLSQIRRLLISTGYKRAEVNQWIDKFSRDLQRRGLIKDEDQLELLYRRWLNDETTYDSLQAGLEGLRAAQQDTEVETEPFDGNIVKIKNARLGEVEVEGDALKIPFLKKVGGKLASIWRDDIKGFFSDDLKNLYEEKIKEFLDNLFSKKTEAEKEARSLIKGIKDASGDVSAQQRQEAREAIERVTEFDPNEYVGTQVPEEVLDEHKALLLKGLTGELEEMVGGRKYDSDVVGDYRSSFNNINNPLIKGLVQGEAEIGNARMFNILFIDGKVALFLQTYQDLINKGVYLYQDREGEWQHNLAKIKVDFYKYLNQQQDKNGWNFQNWDTEPAVHSSFADPAPDPGEFGTPYDDVDPNEDPDVDDGGDI